MGSRPRLRSTTAPSHEQPLLDLRVEVCKEPSGFRAKGIRDIEPLHNGPQLMHPCGAGNRPHHKDRRGVTNHVGNRD